MSPSSRGQILSDIKKASQWIEKRKVELEGQGFKLLENAKYYNPDSGDIEYDRQLGSSYIYYENSTKALDNWDRRHPDRENQSCIENEIQESSEQADTSNENSFDLSDLGSWLLQKILKKAVKQMGLYVINELQSTSTEGLAGAATLGGLALGASLADGQIDRFEMLGILGAAWMGQKIGEAFTGAQKFYQMGVDKLAERNIQQAIICFSKAIGKDNSYCDAYFQRGCSFSAVGNLQQALDDFNQVINLRPGYSSAYTKRATIYYASKKYKAAIDDCNIAIEKKPDHDSYHTRALAYFSTKQYSESYTDFSKAIQHNPKNPLNYLMRGYILLDIQKKAREAIKDFDRVIKLAPRLTEAYICQGRAYFKNRNNKTAISFYTQAIKLGDKEEKRKALAGRCFAYIASGKIWKARFDSLQSGAHHSALRLNTGETVAFIGLSAAIPVTLAIGSFGNLSFQVPGLRESGTMQPSIALEQSNATDTQNIQSTAQAEVTPESQAQLLLTECSRLSTAMQPVMSVQTAFENHFKASGITESITSTEAIIAANSTFSQSLSNLSLGNTQLIQIQQGLIDLSGDIYMNQYYKIQALRQLEMAQTANETNMLSGAYLELNQKYTEFNSRYISLVEEFNLVCTSAQ